MAFVRSDEALDRGGSLGRLYDGFGKRVFDLLISILLLPVLVPVIAALVLLARRDGGPGLYGSTRVGQDGRTFTCWKVRSMIMDPTPVLEAHLAAHPDEAENWSVYRKLSRDPRVTSLGRFLRATSLDELPQIWNVIRGDMSLVGPRPILCDEIEMYGPDITTYQTMKPGITGLWQVSGRNDLSFSERVDCDVEYAGNISFLADTGLILKTVAAVIAKTGR